MNILHLNRKMITDNSPLILAVLRGELVGYFDPEDQNAHLLRSEVVSRTPNLVSTMIPLTFKQLVEYKDWSAEDVEKAQEAYGRES